MIRRVLLGASIAAALCASAQAQSISTPAPPSSPGGSNTQLQYNNSGVFAGAAGLTTTTGSNLIVAAGITISNGGETISSGNLLLAAATALSWGGDTALWRDASNTLAQRNSTTAQTFRLYNTFTDLSNYERATLTWSSNVAYFKPENAGTGTARLLVYVSGSTTVGGLPSASTAGAGAHAFVTDADACVFNSTVTHTAGSTKCPVVSDGTNWVAG